MTPFLIYRLDFIMLDYRKWTSMGKLKYYDRHISTLKDKLKSKISSLVIHTFLHQSWPSIFSQRQGVRGQCNHSQWWRYSIIRNVSLKRFLENSDFQDKCLKCLFYNFYECLSVGDSFGTYGRTRPCLLLNIYASNCSL